MKISLITVCFNSEKTIKDTIKSVLKQTYKNYEYIIIDGKSNDKTLEIVNKYLEKESKIKMVSEKDKGIYDAMNKGIKLASGDIIGILNSDDLLKDEYVFERIIDEFKKTNASAVYGDLLFMDETLKTPVRNFIAHNYSKHFAWHPPHPTLYVKKEVYEKIGDFNLEYKICADFDFMIRLIKGNFKFAYIKEYLVIMRIGGVSTDGLRGYINNLKEANAVLRNNHVSFYHLINIYRILKSIYQGLSAKIGKKRIMKKLERKE